MNLVKPSNETKILKKIIKQDKSDIRKQQKLKDLRQIVSEKFKRCMREQVH